MFLLRISRSVPQVSPGKIWNSSPTFLLELWDTSPRFSSLVKFLCRSLSVVAIHEVAQEQNQLTAQQERHRRARHTGGGGGAVLGGSAPLLRLPRVTVGQVAPHAVEGLAYLADHGEEVGLGAGAAHLLHGALAALLGRLDAGLEKTRSF